MTNINKLFDGDASSSFYSTSSVTLDSANGSGGSSGFASGIKVGINLSPVNGAYPKIKRIEIEHDPAVNNANGRDIEVYLNQLSCAVTATNDPTQNARTRITVSNSTRLFTWNIPNARTTKSITIAREAAVHLSEIQAIAFNGKNMALKVNNPAVTATANSEMSTSTTTYTALKAIDGSTGTIWHSNFNVEQPTIVVDLGSAMLLKEVKVFSRADCCATRVYGGQVEFFSTFPAPGVSPVLPATTLNANNLNIQGTVTGCPASFEDEVRGFWTFPVCPA